VLLIVGFRLRWIPLELGIQAKKYTQYEGRREPKLEVG
jgi:hypothetical protein